MLFFQLASVAATRSPGTSTQRLTTPWRPVCPERQRATPQSPGSRMWGGSELFGGADELSSRVVFVVAGRHQGQVDRVGDLLAGVAAAVPQVGVQRLSPAV
ncbi:MAG TPA: hypothetical protein VFX60_08745 [Micromonospora sp.]|nr:hypothetical protein [Micromonospora sp.]